MHERRKGAVEMTEGGKGEQFHYSKINLMFVFLISDEKERKHIRFNGLKSLLEDVEGICDTGQLLTLIARLGVNTAHDLEEAGQGELNGTLVVILLLTVKETKEALFLLGLLSFLQGFTLCLKFL